MANQITHIALAEKEYDKRFSKFAKADFFIGTVFPDIRYLGVIDREKTHDPRHSLSDILSDQNTAFQAGVKFHCLVDDVREKFMVQNGLYALIPQSKYVTQAIKCLEDDLYYSEVSDWAVYQELFQRILPEETAYGIASSDVARWHKFLMDYFDHSPDEASREVFMISIGFSKVVADEINTLIRQMRENKSVVALIKQLWDTFHTILDEQS